MRILVIGESATDVFIWGDSVRLCPEAAAPVFVAQYQTDNPGMAANTFRNIRSILERKFRTDKDELVFWTNKNTKDYITKTRYIIERTNTTLIRVDIGDKNYGHISDYRKDWMHEPTNIFEEFDAIVISDYNKGFLTEVDIEYIAAFNKNVFLDTKKRLGEWCKNIKFIKLNQEEYEKSQDVIRSLSLLDKLVITVGSQGASYKGTIYPVKRVPVKGVSGAGDSFFAGFAVSYIKDPSVEKAIKFGNKMATLAVQKVGVSVPYDD